MRTILGLGMLSVLMLVTTGYGQIGTPVSCDGTTMKKDKCNYSIPAGYYESEVCEGDLPNNDACKHAIAFAQDDFYCNPAKGDGSTPPMYSTLCLDSSTLMNCTILRTCVGETKSKGTTLYTSCTFLRCDDIYDQIQEEAVGREYKLSLRPTMYSSQGESLSHPAMVLSHHG